MSAVELDASSHEIVERGHAVRHADANRARPLFALACRDVFERENAAGSVVAPAATSLLGRVASRFQFLRGAVAVIRSAARDERFGDRAVPFLPFRLKVR